MNFQNCIVTSYKYISSGVSISKIVEAPLKKKHSPWQRGLRGGQNAICWKVGKCHLYYICRSLPRFEAESRPPQWAQGMIFRFPFKRDVLILIHPISYGKGTSVEIWEFIHIYTYKYSEFFSWVPKYTFDWEKSHSPRRSPHTGNIFVGNEMLDQDSSQVTVAG